MSIEAMKQALEALNWASDQTEPEQNDHCLCPICKGIDALSQAIAEAEKQEPHSWYSVQHDEWMTEKTRKEHERLNSYTHKVGGFDLALYTHPQPKREWVGLTNDEVNNFAAGCHLGKSVQGAIYEAEAKLKEKNT